MTRSGRRSIRGRPGSRGFGGIARKKLGKGAIACLTLLLGSCDLTTGEREFLTDWLVQEESDSAQQARVVDLGRGLRTSEATTELLIASLAGPGDAAEENLSLRFSHSYRRVPGGDRTEREFVSEFRDNATAAFQSRAADALGRIGGPDAARGLRAALRADSSGTRVVRYDVRAAFHRALARAEVSAFDSGDSLLIGATLDTLEIRGRFDSAASVRLEGGPFADDVLVGASDSTVRLVLAAPVGAYEAVVGGAVPGEDRRVALLVDRVEYTPADPQSAPELWSGSRKIRRYTLLSGTLDSASLAPVSGSPVDHFRITPTDSVRVIATAEWRGPGLLRLRWIPCPPTSKPGTFGGFVLDGRSIPVARARISIPGTTISLRTDARGRFEIDRSQLPAVPFQIRVTGAGSATRTTTVSDSAGPMAAVVWSQEPFQQVQIENPEDSRPYQLSRVMLPTRLDAGQCTLLRVDKRDTEVPYTISRITLTFP